MLTMADKEGKGGSGLPPFLADIICEQPLTDGCQDDPADEEH